MNKEDELERELDAWEQRLERTRKWLKREALIDNVLAGLLCLWAIGFCLALAVMTAQ